MVNRHKFEVVSYRSLDKYYAWEGHVRNVGVIICAHILYYNASHHCSTRRPKSSSPQAPRRSCAPTRTSRINTDFGSCSSSVDSPRSFRLRASTGGACSLRVRVGGSIVFVARGCWWLSENAPGVDEFFGSDGAGCGDVIESARPMAMGCDQRVPRTPCTH